VTHRLTLPLFGEDELPERKLDGALARMEGGSPAQRKFQTLVAQVTRSRDKLEQWQACDARVQRRLTAELGPRMMRMRALQLDMLQQIDTLLEAPRAAGGKARSQAARLRAWLRRLIDSLDPEGSDATLEPARARHHYAERRTQEHALGQLPPGIAQPPDHSDKTSAKREAKRRARRERAAAALQEDTARAGQSLREVYRRLAMALHPDRELDPERRKEKTTLIQRVNQAYESGDLLTLLGIHLESQPADRAGLGDLPEEKLEHFSQILRQQLANLEKDIERLVQRLGEAASIPPWQTPSQRLIDQAVSLDIAQADQFIDDLEADLARLIGSGMRVTRLASLPDDAPEERSIDKELDEILATLAASAPPARRRRRR
jgi:hypothetical protein